MGTEKKEQKKRGSWINMAKKEGFLEK